MISSSSVTTATEEEGAVGEEEEEDASGGYSFSYVEARVVALLLKSLQRQGAQATSEATSNIG